MAPAGGASAGYVYVDILPNTTNFWPTFVAQTTPGAAAAGDALGLAMGAAMAARIRASVNGALSGLTTSAGAHGAALGNRFGGTFADTAERRIRAALRSLPEAQIGVATTAAEQKLRDLRSQLETLSSRRIGIDISETEAREEVRRLKDELDQLARVSASPRIRVDTGNASLELRRLEEELNRLDGRRANARVDVDEHGTAEALSRMGALISAGLALGPAIIPIAAAAAAAVAGIGVAAISAVPAVGVLALAFSGIGGAVKALANAQAESAKTENTAAQQAKSLASGTDQVRSAVISLANARASAGDAHRRSLQQIADAERQVVQAQREAKGAQDALNESREEERRSQEDTAFALRQNAIDQRRAAAEVKAATAAAARSGGQQAKDALDEALLRQEELRVAGERLTAEQERNTETGVEGSKRVVAAQEAVAQSQQRIGDAERGVTEARRQAASQARQSAVQIAQAQQAIVTAQRSAVAAAAAAASTSGAALDKLNETLDALPVSGQAFARFLFGLRPELKALREEAADGLLPGAQAGITALLPYLGGLRTWVGDVAEELGDVAEQGGRALSSPFWRQFFNFIGNDAVPTLDGLFHGIGNVTEGTARMILAFQPFEEQVGGGISSVTERYLAFSRGLDRNEGFQNFVKYALVEGPHVVALLSGLFNIGVRLTQAYAPVGSVVVGVLRGIAAGLNAIPLPVLTGLVVGITAYKSAVLLAAGVQGLLNSGLLTGIARMITYGTVTTTVTVGGEALTRSTTAATRALQGASGAIGGPFILALTAAAATIGFLIYQQQKAKRETDAYRSSLESFAGGFRDGVTPASLDAAKATLAHDKALRGVVETTKRAGIDTTTLIAGLNGDRDARDKVVAGLNAQIASAEEAAKMYGQLGAGQQQNAKSASDEAERLKKLRSAFVEANDSAADAIQLTGALADEQRRANDTFEGASAPVKKLAEAYQVLATETASAAEKADALKQAEDALFGAARDADQAAEDQFKAIRKTNETLAAKNALDGEGAKTLDLKTEAGARLRDTLKDELAAINATFRANVAAGMAIEEATKQHDDEIKKLKDKAVARGIDGDATQKLIDLYGLIPTSADTAITITGLGATKTALDELLAYQLALRTGISLGEARDKISPEVKLPGGQGQSRGVPLATGGPVVGPGTGTSDSVPAMERSSGAPFWLSNGEFVHNTAAVQYYGPGFMHAVNDMKLPKQVARGFAGGGLLDEVLHATYPYPTSTEMTRIPSRAEVARVVQEGPSSGGSEEIKAFIRSVDRLPYVWATAGPSGYDCSGLASAVYGLVRGLGGGRGQRYFTTHDFAGSPPAGFKPGAGGVLTVGVNPATHMAGNYGGLGFEAASTKSGIKIGTAAKKVSSFEKQFHLASGGFVSTAILDELGLDIGGDPSGMTVGGRKVPLGVYDSGGYLPPGLSLAYNGTGVPEPVSTADQAAAAGQPSITIPVYGSDGQSVTELAKAVAAELAWQMR